ncbi:hypothetical protein SAMN05216382_0949 [Sphingomonas palmae]|uniref:Uncharacterized protein n=1 Tax=Sphingomonas palmae TaxID=1855283 RepID=A0A1H7J7G7_9SPHN|nr:hypothetical protein [Sphingomonas palmae]SEK70162.1 hypothetical protein SAMN05216382_0949 [Sphingomonas palmae]
MEVLVSTFIERFLTTFGARSIVVAQTQCQQATGNARASWLLILRLLEQEAGTCAEPSIAHDHPTPN